MEIGRSFSARPHITYEVEITDNSSVGEARRQVKFLSEQQGFSELQIGQIAIVVTELATNILKHAGSGYILYSVDSECLSVIALDKGPGIAQWESAAVDGFSTAGTPGNGIGAVNRLSSKVDFYAEIGTGTAILARFYRQDRQSILSSEYLLGSVAVCYPGEIVSGDAWCLAKMDDTLTLAIIDGLGHGALANSAALKAVETVEAHAQDEPTSIMSLAHKNLMPTRGAAMAVMQANLAKDVLTHSGVGNTTATIFHRDVNTKRMISYDGTIGLAARKIQQFVYPFPKGAVLVLATDGIQTHWDLKKYPGLLAKDPLLIAAVLYRDTTRRRDDATIVVLKRVDHE